MNIPEIRFPKFDGDWVKHRIGEITTKVGSGSTPTGGSKSYQPEGIIFIRSQNVNNDMLYLVNVVFISDETNEKMSGSKVQANDILLNITGASIGRSCVVPMGFQTGNVNQHVCIIRLSQDYHPYFLQPFLSSAKGQKLIFQEQAGGGREGLNFQSIRGFKVCFPLLPEQQKIASFFTAIDKKISQLKKKKTLLEQYKKSVMQKIFSQEIRFKDNNGQEFPKWEKEELGNYFTERNEIADDALPLYSLTIENGITPKTERYERSFLVNDKNDAYKVMHKDDFAFNPMNLRFGALARHKGNQNVAVSKYYNIFYCNEESSSSFFDYYLTNSKMILYYNKMATGSLVEKKRVHYLDFIKFSRMLPSLHEQTKIADFLSVIDNKINHTKTQIEKAELWKKGLLKRMFV